MARIGASESSRVQEAENTVEGKLGKIFGQNMRKLE